MIWLRVLLLLLAMLMVSCSNSDEQETPEETPQERIGREAAEQITSTLQSAKDASELENQHTQQIEEAVQKNSEEQ